MRRVVSRSWVGQITFQRQGSPGPDADARGIYVVIPAMVAGIYVLFSLTAPELKFWLYPIVVLTFLLVAYHAKVRAQGSQRLELPLDAGTALSIGAALLLLFGLQNRASLVIGLALTGAGVFLWFHTKHAANAVFLKHRPRSARLVENQLAEIEIDVINAGAAALRCILIEDYFGASRETAVRLASEEPVAGRARLRLRYRAMCDAGMGRHRLGPLRAIVRDPLGLFEFHVYDDEDVEEIEVAPAIQKIPELPVQGTAHSDRYGNYEVNSRGLSVNFVGVRPYVFGDPLRHVAWKPSAKSGRLMVKEFEKSVSCEATVVPNLDPALHVGSKEASTWEAVKDAALAVVANLAEQGNSIEVILGERVIERGAGREHVAAIAREVAGFDLLDAERHQRDLFKPGGWHPLRAAAHRLAPGMALFYVAPYHLHDRHAAYPILRSLALQGVQAHCIAIDSASLWSKVRDTEAGMALAKMTSRENFDADMDALRRAGVHVTVASPTSDVRLAFGSGAAP